MPDRGGASTIVCVPAPTWLVSAIACPLIGVNIDVNVPGLGDLVDHRITFEQAIEPFLAALCLTGALPCLEAPHELRLLGDVLLLFLIGALLREFLDFLLLHEGRIIPRITG